MKTIKLLAALAIFTFVAVSCNRGNDDYVKPIGVIESVNDLVVPSDFDWKTTQTVMVSVQLPVDGEIEPLIITNREGTIRYFRGYPEDGSRTVNTKITIPSYVYELRLTYSGTNGPNMVFINNETLVYDFNMKSKSTAADGCDLSGYITFSKGGWSSTANGNNPGTIRDAHFTDVYPNGFVIGTGKTITFTTSAAVAAYLPGGGGSAVLTQNWVNPVKSDKLGNMADQIIAARLARDYNAKGHLGTTSPYKLGELVFTDGPFENMTVNAFLAEAEIALGGGGLNGHSEEDYKNAAENIALNFDDGNNEEALTCPTEQGQNDPFIELSGECIEGDVVFTILNSGDGDMTSSNNYTLYKNDEIVKRGNYKLDVNETKEISKSGISTDVFKMVVEKPEGGSLEETVTACGGGTPEQLAGTLAYEDLWPGKGDYDFNDLIIDYDFAVTKDNQERVQSIKATFVVKAFGASYHNGFGFTLPTVSPEDIVSVSGYDVVNNTVFNIAGNGLENNQSKATIIVFDDVRRVMPQLTGGIGVNTQLEYAYTEPVTIVVNIVFANNAITYGELNIGSFNPFLVVNTEVNGAPGERGWEIHLPNYAPSDLMDVSLFGQWEDNSSVAAGRYFVTDNNLPWAINIAEGFDWVIEFQDITGAYNWFAEWAQSGGTNYQDWYKDLSGYRDDTKIYPTQIGN